MEAALIEYLRPAAGGDAHGMARLLTRSAKGILCSSSS